MNQSERHDRVTKLFRAASDVPPEQRHRYLDEHCPDPEIRREVEAMLAADDTPQGFLQAPVLGRGYHVRWTTPGSVARDDDQMAEIEAADSDPLSESP